MPSVAESAAKQSAELRRALQALTGQSPLVYVDCGARGGKLPRAFRSIRDSRYIGFEADGAECARLNADPRPGHRYVPAFLDSSRRTRQFHLTASAACASFLVPDHQFLAAFGELAAGFRVEREVTVETVALDDCLVADGVTGIDFLELDTQGTELDVLAGAGQLLRNSVVGLQVEVEFAPMYLQQPLFGDVDAFLRARGFQLFDLSRYRARRSPLEAVGQTRGQLLWGHAFYLLRLDEEVNDQRASRLAVVAALTGCPDYAAQVLQRLASATDAELRQKASRTLRALSAEMPRTDQPAIWRD